jgi:hypothetical protein
VHLRATLDHERIRLAAGGRRIHLSASAHPLRYLLLLVIALAGCGVLPRNPVPPQKVGDAEIPGMPEIRAWGGRPSPAIERDLADSFAQESPADFPLAADGLIHYAHLALSGGGANGAFGAGFLKGWTETGHRPVFKIVTGVSTGALMAPFAFLGPAHDDDLHRLYTQTRTRDIIQLRLHSLLPQLLAGDALADSGPLANLIARHVDANLLREVAAAHLGGRRLYIGTVDLDAQQFVVWNMGKIAASGRPDALDLFRTIMLASASIPIAFPPVFFEVEVDGHRYDEMHVDGGVGARVFLTGGVFRVSGVREVVGRGPARSDVFVIHNGQLGPVVAPTRRTVRSIATRVLDTTGKSAVIGDLFRIYAISLRAGAGFHWVTIPDGIETAGSEFFDPERMSQLYDVGYRKALAGPEWSTAPPGLNNNYPR